MQSALLRAIQYNAKGIRNCFLMPFACRTTLVALILQTVAANLQLVATNLQTDKTDNQQLVPPAGFEPAIYTLKGCCPGPLDDGGARH